MHTHTVHILIQCNLFSDPSTKFVLVKKIYINFYVKKMKSK